MYLIGFPAFVPLLGLACVRLVFMLGDPVRDRVALSLGIFLLVIGFGAIVAWTINQDLPRILSPIARIGFYSYSIYLWHLLATMCLLTVVRHWWSLPGYVCVAI